MLWYLNLHEYHLLGTHRGGPINREAREHILEIGICPWLLLSATLTMQHMWLLIILALSSLLAGRQNIQEGPTSWAKPQTQTGELGSSPRWDLQVALNGLLSLCISVSLHSIHTRPLWDDVAQVTIHFRVQRLWKCQLLLYELSCLSHSENTAGNGSHIVQIIYTFVSEHGHFVTQPLVNTGVLMLQFCPWTLHYPAFGELCEVLTVQFWPWTLCYPAVGEHCANLIVQFWPWTLCYPAISELCGVLMVLHDLQHHPHFCLFYKVGGTKEAT